LKNKKDEEKNFKKMSMKKIRIKLDTKIK